MGELTRLANLGPKVEEQLNAVGISTAEQLEELGSRQAWLRIREIDSSA